MQRSEKKLTEQQIEAFHQAMLRNIEIVAQEADKKAYQRKEAQKQSQKSVNVWDSFCKKFA